MPVHALIRDRGYYGPHTLIQTHKQQIACAPSEPVVVCLTDSTTFSLIPLAPGSFLFEGLLALNILPHAALLLEDGLMVDLDQRIWTPRTFTIHLRGAGTATWWGLSMAGIQALASFMRTLLPQPAKCVLHGFAWQDGRWTLHFGSGLSHAPELGEIHCICVLLDGHWILLTLRLSSLSGFSVGFWDGLAHPTIPPRIAHLLEQFMVGWTLDCVRLDSCSQLVQHGLSTCGTILLGHLGLAIGLFDAMNVLDFETYHDRFVAFEHSLFGFSSTPFIGFGKGGGKSTGEAQLLLQLATVLQEKGVPQDRVEERAALGLRKIGYQEIEAALQSANPWTYLKAIASRPHVSFQWIHADELQSKIRAKASAKFQIQAKTGKKHPKPAGETKPLWIDPNMLQLVPGTFYAQDKEIGQIQFSDVTSSASGLAFCAIADVMPFLKAGTTLSDKPLAVITTTPIPADHGSALVVNHLRFPAQFRGTNEPVLLQGSIVMLGPVPITRGNGGTQCVLEHLPTQTVRLCVFRDQWEGQWSDFILQPVRAVLQQHPLLTLCKISGCGEDCVHYHAAVDEPLDSVILDLWARSWHRADSRFTKPADASYWSVLIRVPASAQTTIQGLSGFHGLYVEPRSDSGRATDDRYGMIWLGELSFTELVHKLKTTPHAVAIGRLRQKYGLRFLQEHKEAGTTALKPHEPFVATKVDQLYRLYPLPFGTQRVALQKCLSEWGWMARVRQAIGGGAEGTAWEVGASQPPPSSILPGPNGDVAITLLKKMNAPDPSNTVLASSTTKRFLQNASGGTDPWTQGMDPWGGYSGSSSSAPRAADKMQQLEDRLHKQVVETVRKEVAESTAHVETDTPMDFADLGDFRTTAENRFARLETGMQELQSQTSKFENWFSQMHQTEAQLQTQLQLVTQQVEVQGHGIEQVRKDLTMQVGGLQEGLNTVQSDVTKGFTRLEALLEKRAKGRPALLGCKGRFQFCGFFWSV